MKRVYLSFITVLMLLYVIHTIGGGCTQTTGYKELIVSEDMASFSFEYPAFYDEPYVSTPIETQSIEVDAGGLIQPRVSGAEFLFITVLPVSDSFPNAKTMLDYEFSLIEGLPDFQLLERSPVTIAGSQGEQVIYSYYGYHTTWESPAETGTAYDAYFDSGGLIWIVELIADEYTAAERAKADFEHILETFQILD